MAFSFPSFLRGWVLCGKAFPGDPQHTCHTHVCSPQTGLPQETQVLDNTKLQLCEPMRFIGVTYRYMGEKLQEQKDSETAASPRLPQHGRLFRKAGKLGEPCTACRQLSRLESMASQRLWSEPLPGCWSQRLGRFFLLESFCSSDCLRIFFAAQLPLV